MNTSARRSTRKSRIKTGSVVKTKKRAYRRKKRKGKSKSITIKSILGKTIAILLALVLLSWIIYSVLIPHWLFSLDRPKNILVVPTNLEESSDVVLFVHLDTDEQNSELHLIDGAATVNVVGGYGEYQLQNIFPLLKLESKDEQFVLAALNNALGVVIDEILTVETLTLDMIQDSRAPLIFLDQALTDKRYFKEYLQLYYLAKNNRNTSAISVPEFASSISQYKTLGVETARECPVAVINTTGTTGLASVVSEIIEENGGLVVRVTNQYTDFTSSSLYVSTDSREVCQPLIDLVTRIFPASLKQIPATDNLTGEYRAKLILFLGEDSAQILGQ